jgi:Undecaprenyl-phosphate glucose phosphotransferase
VHIVNGYPAEQTINVRVPKFRFLISGTSIVDRFAQLPPQRPVEGNLAAASSTLLPLLDFASLLLLAWLGTLTCAGLASHAGTRALPVTAFGHSTLIAAVLAPFILYDRRSGVLATHGSLARALRFFLTRFVLFAGVLGILGLASRMLESIPPFWIADWLAVALLLTAATRVAALACVRLLQRQGVLNEVIAVVGAGPLADRLVATVKRDGHAAVEILGVFDDKLLGAPACEIAARGDLAKLLELGATRRIDWIILTLPPAADDRIRALVERLKVLGVPIGLCPEQVGLTLPYRVVDYVGAGVPVSLLSRRPLQRWGAVQKATEDLLLGSLMLLVLLPLMALVALAIKLDSPGPIIFKQRRHAVNNREFDIYKFRSMRWEGPDARATLVQTTRSDRRVTRVGRLLRATSLDELPQLFNVLKGEMSLVGPRPHAIDMRTENQLGAQITQRYPHRHRVKPGITGWSQVKGARGATDTVEQLHRRVELDLQYIDQWSLLLDLKILALTTSVVLKRDNAF